MVLKLFDASFRSVSGHGLTQGPLVDSRLRIIDILLKEGRRTVNKQCQYISRLKFGLLLA